MFLSTLINILFSHLVCDRYYKPNEPSREPQASLLSRLTFSWFNPLIKLGSKKPLTEDDIWDLIDSDKTDALSAHYSKVKDSNPKGSLVWCLFLLVWPLILFQFIVLMIAAFLSFAGPVFLNKIINFVENPDEVDHTHLTAYVYVMALFASTVVKAIAEGQGFYAGRRIGMRLRSVLIAEIYRKSLTRIVKKRGASSLKDNGLEDEASASIGKIVTIMSVDTEKVREISCYLVRLSVSSICLS